MLRYRADNLPGVGMGAFMPNLTRPGWASSVGLETATVVGFPGTDPVPIERTWNISPLGWEPHGFTKPSKCAPDEITPAVYLSHTRNMGPFAPKWGGGYQDERPGAPYARHARRGGSHARVPPGGRGSQ